MMDVQIVPLEAKHIGQIAEIEKSCFSDPWSEAAVAEELSNPLAFWLVAERDGAVLGYVGSQIVPDEADLMNLAVRQESRRQGIARLLMERMLAGLREKAVVSLSLEVRASNDAAAALYAQLGFREVGVRKNYYFHPKEDARILKKEWSL